MARPRKSSATTRAGRKPVDFAALPTEALNPRSRYLDALPAEDVVRLMVDEEAVTLKAVKSRRKEIAAAAKLAAQKMLEDGRLIYVGAGTSGRLGTLDASECVPTFGIKASRVVPIIAGGPAALTDAIEGAEDRVREAEERMRRAAVGPKDCVICIAASGVTPFVRAALAYAHFRKSATIFITCRKLPPPPPGEYYADVLIELPTGPEVVAGSTRLKAGTATKITLNAISTTAFVLLGKTYAGLMVDVRPTNEKLKARAHRIVRMLSGLGDKEAADLLERAGGLAKVALVMHNQPKLSEPRARELLAKHRGSLREIVGDLELHDF